MNIFNTDENLVARAKKLTKHESKLIEDNGNKIILCGTPLAYEDDLCNNIYDCFNELSCRIGLPHATYEQYCDEISAVRDIILETVLKANNAQIVHGYEEF